MLRKFSRQHLLAFVLITSMISLIIAYLIEGIIASILIGAVLIFILLITKNVWLPENHGNTLIRRISLATITLIATTFSFWNNLIPSLVLKPLANILTNYGVDINPFLTDIINQGSPPIEILIFTILGIFIVNYSMRDNSAMGKINKEQKDLFPEIAFPMELEGLGRVLENSLRDIDLETNWSDEFFVPLDAEVEIKAKSSGRKSITNLLTALKKNNSEKALLILGDPGSGKSVALRKLAKDLISEIKTTGKIPVYINLREWEFSKKGTNNSSLPTTKDLHKFIFENLKEKCDLYASEFLDKYFDRMVKAGRVFFILDSFDEIPLVLDEDESSELIDHLSSTIYNFLGGATTSRGVLSSRIFRRPTNKFKAKTILEIRPFSEVKIFQRFQKSVNYDFDIKKVIFQDRPEFISLARNPFSSSLILNYMRHNSGTLPENRIDFYQDYIDRQINRAEKQKNLNSFTSRSEFIELCSEIAFYMYEAKNYGLEVPVDALKKKFGNDKIENFLSIIQFIRLGRIGAGKQKLFSFVHRRFNEFLIAKTITVNDSIISLDSIPTDSRWRDALALYCEIAPIETVSKIADYCWKEIDSNEEQKINLISQESLRKVHALRFLSEAFKARKEALFEFSHKISTYILNQLDSNNLLLCKILVESTGILTEDDSDKVFKEALKINNPWVSDSAIRSCRNLPKISSELEEQIKGYILKIEFGKFYYTRKDLLFTFSLSEGFNNVHKFCKLLDFDFKLLFWGIILVTIANPIVSAVLIGLLFLATKFILVTDILPKKYREDKDLKKYSFIQMFNKTYGDTAVSFTETRPLFTMIRAAFSPLIVIKAFSEPFNYEILDLITLSCSIISALFVFPWISVYLGIPKLKYISIKRLLIAFFSVIAFVIIEDYIPEMIGKIAFIIYSCIFLIAVIHVMISILRSLSSDKKKIAKLNLPTRVERQYLYKLLSEFKTSYGRKKFVQIVESEHVKVFGEWPNFEVPNYNDKASTHLAQLEEKWLGFDR